MDAAREIEIREEARFVLWALRCCAARSQGEGFEAELLQGFELADVEETTAAFRRFAHALCQHAAGRVTWHGPRCACLSFGEILILQALATSGESLGEADIAPAPWWSGVVALHAAPVVDRLARHWLGALQRAGIRFPRPAELVVSLSALDNLIGTGEAAQVH